MKWTGLSLFCLLLQACASSPPDMSDISGPTIQIHSSSIAVSDLSRKHPQHSVYSTGFNHLTGSITTPAFHVVLVNAMKSRLHGESISASPLEMTIIDAGILIETSFADKMPFLGIAMAFSKRRYMCEADVSFKYGSYTDRKKFMALDERNRSWGDLDTEDKHLLVDQCVSSIITDMSTFISSFTS